MSSGSPRVLVGFAESLAAVETVWCLLDHGYDVVVFCRDGARPALRRDPRVQVVPVPAPESDLRATVDAVRRAAERVWADVLVPVDDAALLVLDRLGPSAPPVAGATGSLVEVAVDKRLQLAHAREAGLAVPPTLVVEPGDRPAVSDLPVGSAWIVKPAMALDDVGGRLAKGASVFAEDAATVLRSLEGRSDPLLVQPHLRGRGHGVFGVAAAGQAERWSGHERVRMMNPSGSGSSACRSWAPPSDLLDRAGRFTRLTGWEGMFMIELLIDEAGTPWFMELNGRAWGSLALAERRDLHYPAWTVALRLRAPAPVAPPVTGASDAVVARHLGRELLHLAFVARGRHQLRAHLRADTAPEPGLSDYPTLPRALADVARWSRHDRLYNYRRGRGPVLTADTLYTVRSVLPQRTRR